MTPVDMSLSWRTYQLTLALLVATFVHHCVVVSQGDGPHASMSDPTDPHGGVIMGKSNPVCDDGITNIELDWDPFSSEEYTCTGDKLLKVEDFPYYFHCDVQAQRPLHVCYPRPITYSEDLPTSGAHRPLWPQYGEYKYVPIQRWLHNLEHGAVVYLYNPCAPSYQIETFKGVAKSCLRKHIISPFKKLPPGMNFALLTWTCKLVMSKVDVSAMVQFVKEHALKAPEGMLNKDGQYNVSLIQPAAVVSDLLDSELCPKMSLMSHTASEIKASSLKRKTQAEEAQERLIRVMERFLMGF